MNISKKKLLLAILSAVVILITVLSCLLLYYYDNKYTRMDNQPKQGILMLDNDISKSSPVIFLINSWAYYDKVLLTPKDFIYNPPIPDEYLFIGQYGGLDRNKLSSSPHGSATYRMQIQLPERPYQYALEVPEIFSAYRIYINNQEFSSMGIPERNNYHPAIGNQVLTFEASGHLDILIAVSDYTHFYSGIVYPPAFGSPEAVIRMVETRLIFRTILCATAGVIGFLSVLIGIMSRKKISFQYGLLCLCFIGYTGYPIWRTFTSWYGPLYAVENICFCAVLLLSISIQRTLFGTRKSNKWEKLILTFGSFMILTTIIVHATLGFGNLSIMRVYSTLINIYQLAVSVFLTVSSFVAIKRQEIGALSVLCGILILDTSLFMDRMLPLFEPIVTGWFAELATAASILCIGLATGTDVARQYRQSAVLSECVHSAERLLSMQQTYHMQLSKQAEETRFARHDMRHHFTVMKFLLESKQYDTLQKYLNEYGGSVPSDGPVHYCNNGVANAIADYYTRVSDENSIPLSLQIDIPQNIMLTDTELSCILSNLLENALEACLRIPNRNSAWITLYARNDPAALAFYMENSTNEVCQSGSRFLSRKSGNHVGYGLRSVQYVANNYGGRADFHFDKKRSVFVSTVLIPKNNPH